MKGIPVTGKITHVVVIRPDSALVPLFAHRAQRAQGGTGALVLRCTKVREGLPGFVAMTVDWSCQSSPQENQIPLSEILLIADATSSDPQPIGFLRE
jgi:hypothetical protein